MRLKSGLRFPPPGIPDVVFKIHWVYQTVSNDDCRPIFRTHWILSRSTVWKTNIAIEQDHLYLIYLLKMVIVHSSASLPNLKVTSHFCSSNPQVTCWTSRNIPHLRTPRAWHAEILGVAKLPTDVTTTTEILNSISIILALNSSIFGEVWKKTFVVNVPAGQVSGWGQ